MGRPLAMQITNGPEQLLGRAVTAGAYFVDVHIAGQVVNSLVDTGACVTVISEHLFKSLPNTQLENPPESMTGFEGVVQGSKLQVLGIITQPIMIGEFQSRPHKIVVVPGSRMECILGMDFLDKYCISVDTQARQLQIGVPGRNPVVVDVNPKFTPNHSYKVVVSHITELPPRTMLHVPVQVSNLEADIDGCIEGLNLDNPKFLVARSLNSVENRATGVVIANVTGSTIVLHPHQRVGTFSPIDECKGIHGLQTGDLGGPEPIQVPVHQLFDLSATDLTEEQKY